MLEYLLWWRHWSLNLWVLRGILMRCRLFELLQLQGLVRSPEQIGMMIMARCLIVLVRELVDLVVSTSQMRSLGYLDSSHVQLI
jgi:hypothetical protein